MSCLMYNPSRTFLRSSRLVCSRLQNYSITAKGEAEKLAPKNLLRDKDVTTDQAAKGHIYDKRPFKFPLEAGKKYAWCACGKSKSQPFCDGTHKNAQLKITLKPVIVMVEESKEYYLCNCKQTSNRPFCDGTHKRQDIQDAVRY